MTLKPGIVGLALIFLQTGAAVGEELTGSPAQGLDFAREHCAACHYVEPERTIIPLSREIAFWEMAEDPLITGTAIRVFLQTPHIEMPNFILAKEDTDNVVAYILSLKR